LNLNENVRGVRQVGFWTASLRLPGKADRQAIFAVFPKLKEEFGFDKEQLGWIGPAFMWVYAGGALLAGLIVDRFRRKDLILGGCLFWSFVTVTTGWCSKLWHFMGWPPNTGRNRPKSRT